MKRSAAAPFVGLLIIAAASNARAGPWTKNLGDVYVKTGEGFFLSDNYVDGSGVEQIGTSYRGYSTFAYFEAGVWDGVHVQGFLPYTIAQNHLENGDRFTRGGGADAQLGVQVALPVPKALLAARATFKIPLYPTRATPTQPTVGANTDSQSYPALGDGQVDATLWISGGGGIPDSEAFGFAELGYRLRTDYSPGGRRIALDYGDSFVFSGQLGWFLSERFLIGLNVNGVVPFSNDDVTKAFVVGGPSIYVLIAGGIAVEASFDPVLWARASSRGVGFSIGVSYKRDAEESS